MPKDEINIEKIMLPWKAAREKYCELTFIFVRCQKRLGCLELKPANKA